MSGVQIEHLTKRFGTTPVLNDVSLDIAFGELVALLGPSGCGKTTLLRSVAGLETPDRGRVSIGGIDVTRTPVRERPIGMMFQGYVLFPNMTLRENTAFPLKMRGMKPAVIRRRVDELLDLVGLTARADHYPNQVSGGQQQRGALARALAPEPAVLLLDEPLSALDALVRTRLRDEVRRIQQLVKITALYVTHDQGEALAIADRVVVMNGGRIEQAAAPATLYDSPATRFSAGFVGNRNVLELAAEAGRIRFGAAFSVAAPVGDRAVAFIRPEDVRVSANGPGEPATVEQSMFQGVLTRVHLTVGNSGVRLYADLPSREARTLTPGSAVHIQIDPAAISVFPAEG